MGYIMKKRDWDGSFQNSMYTETGNMVNDIIENGGRLVHESTVDGYTHEVVDRGQYISDDYYFPSGNSKKAHIHYEIHSNGDIVIDGKKLAAGGSSHMSGIKHGRELSRNKGLDGTIIQKEYDNHLKDLDAIHKLGEKFNSDKQKLEAEIEKVEQSNIKPSDKSQLILILNAAIEELKTQYDREVSAEEEKLKKSMLEQTENMQNAADELNKQAASLRSVRMDAASTDASVAADAADSKKQAIEQMKTEYLEQLNLRIQAAKIQQRNILNRRRGDK